MTTAAGTATLADPFDAGPYARVQAALRLPHRGWRSGRRALIMTAVAWVPLVVLAAAEGLLWRPDPRESLLLDLTAYSRYLIAVPLLVLAEEWCLPRLSAIVRQFVTGGVVTEADLPRFDALVASARRLLAHRGTEVVLVLVAYAATVAQRGAFYPTEQSTWVAPIEHGVRVQSLAGWWRALVSQPLYLLLVAVWLWRVAVWARFLWGVSRLDLRLVPAHPDRAGGLYFASTSLTAFAAVALALSAGTAGVVAEDVLFVGRWSGEVQYVVGGLCVVVVTIFTAPLLVFFGPLRRARVRGIFAYGALASAVGRRFEERWLRAGQLADADALSVPDFSATTDLYAIAANVREMQVVPVGLRPVLVLAVATLLPFVPVAAAILPVDRLLALVTQLLF